MTKQQIARAFDHFVAIDWSGAIGSRHRGIAVAIADAAGGPPVLVPAPQGWTREEILRLLTEEFPANSLIGLDLGTSLPFLDRKAFFPGWEDSPPDARSLWAMVDQICAADEHLSATSFVDHPIASRYFRRHGGREGVAFGGGRGRFRVTECAQALMGCKPYSNFNLVGAAQVGKSSLTGMRVLHRLTGRLPVWPIDSLPQYGSVVVEIYTALAAMAAGRSASRSKIRSHEDLDIALANQGSPPLGKAGPIDDHSSDALVTAAWLRTASRNGAYWQPEGLNAKIAQMEGWTFGVS